MRLQEKGAVGNFKDIEGKTLLHWGLLYGSHKISETLVDKGENLDVRDSDGRCCLALAAATHEDSKPKVILLLEAGRNHEAPFWTLVDKVVASVAAFTDLDTAKILTKHDTEISHH